MTQSQFDYLPILITESYVFNLKAHNNLKARIKKFGIEDCLHFNLQFCNLIKNKTYQVGIFIIVLEM